MDNDYLIKKPPLQALFLFALPMIIGNLFQQTYTMVDSAIVGRYVSEQALAAVGAYYALTNIFICVAIGGGIGASVIVSRYFGAKEYGRMKTAVFTALLSFLGISLVLGIAGLILGKQIMIWLNTPADCLDMASEYLRIYFLGLPFLFMYNVLSAMFNALGKSRIPLYFLIFSSIFNVIIDIIMVTKMDMGVAGVATATVVSECISAVLIVQCLARSDSAYRLCREKMRITESKVKQIMKIGLPAGFQGAIFSVSNVLIQSSINSFGSIAMAGSTASANVEGFVYNAMNAVYQTTLSFTSQNYGAGKMDRVTKILLDCLGLVVLVGVVMGGGAVLLGPKLLQIYSSDPEVISYGMMRMRIINGSYFLCGIMDTMVGGLRGLGYSVVPMLVSLTGACLFRVVWIFSVFAMHRTVTTLYLSYPVSWIITFTAHIICYIVIRRRMAARRKSWDEI